MFAERHDDAGAGAIWLLVIVALAIGIRSALFVGIVGVDDASIAHLALKVLDEGPYLPFDHYSSRVGLIYPQAAIFAVFGVGEWQMAVLPMIASLAGLFLAFLIGRHYGGYQVGLFAAVLIALFPLDAYYSSQLMPDLPLGAMLALTFYLLLRAQLNDSAKLAILAGLVWGWAYLIKVEAFFLLFVVLTLWMMRQLSFKLLFFCGVGVGAVVLAEHLVYFLASTEGSARIDLVTSAGGGKIPASDLGGAELWIFPKAWFLTPYQFGLHYYMLFLSLFWVMFARRWRYFPLLVWGVIYLFWLQFGGNPFSEHYQVKSHIDRYCNMLNVPMAVLIGLLLGAIRERFGVRGFLVMFVPTIALPMLFIPFNQLSAERHIATKQLLDIVREQNMYPLYLDRTSLTLAGLYLYDDVKPGDLISLQKHDFNTMHTIVPDPVQVDGAVLINRGFVEYGKVRYGVTPVYEEDFKAHREYARVDNPLGEASYISARFLRWMAGFIPMEFFRNKIQNTADSLLEGNDAVLLEKR